MSCRRVTTVISTIVSLPCLGWSPQVHALQTKFAKGLIPKAMAEFIDRHHAAFSESGRGLVNAHPPTPEDVEGQFLKLLKISENRRPLKEIVRELGHLANMVQLLTDPSATGGAAATRRVFSDFADEHFGKLVAVRAPLFAAKGDLDPRAAIQAWGKAKYERYSSLSNFVNLGTGAKIGAWDTLSVPFAHMQLSFSEGVNATANIWIMAWRMAGAYWVE
jgi:hypothetical protein